MVSEARNITHSQGCDSLHIYFRIHFDKYPRASAQTEEYLCEVADGKEVLCFNILWAKEKKRKWLSFLKGKREREKFLESLRTSVGHKRQAKGTPAT